jgi:hypothetical protein
MTVEEYRLLLAPWPVTAQQADQIADAWFRAADDYCLSEGDESKFARECGSIGEFMGGADRLCDWLMANGEDAYPVWDVVLAIDDRLDGLASPSFREIARLINRATLAARAIHLAAHYSARVAGTGGGAATAPLIKDRFKSPPCKFCRSEDTYVPSSPKRFRWVACRQCGKSFKVAK